MGWMDGRRGEVWSHRFSQTLGNEQRESDTTIKYLIGTADGHIF
jgi:hypothetical protein